MSVIELRVHMDCSGCETTIKKAIEKLDGVDSVDIDMAMQKVTVMGWAASNQKKILKTVRKTGRRAELWPYPYNPEYYYNYNREYHSNNNHVHGHHDMASIININHYANKAPMSSYNYRKHGYGDDSYGYYQQGPYSTIFNEQASNLFSDDNPHACSIM